MVDTSSVDILALIERDKLMASGQVSRIKIPGSRVQWFYQLSEDEMTVTGHAQDLDA